MQERIESRAQPTGTGWFHRHLGVMEHERSHTVDYPSRQLVTRRAPKEFHENESWVPRPDVLTVQKVAELLKVHRCTNLPPVSGKANCLLSNLAPICHYLWVVESKLCAQTEDCWLGGRSLYIRAIAVAAAPVREHRWGKSKVAPLPSGSAAKIPVEAK